MITALLVGFGLAVAAVFTGLAAASWLLLRAVLWVVLLPFKLIGLALLLPLALLKLVLVAVVGVIALALLIAGAAAIVGVGLAVVAPLLPIALVFGLFWLVVRAGRRPMAAR